MTLLITATGTNLAPAFYIMAAAAITLAVVLTAHETAPIRQGAAVREREAVAGQPAP